MRAGSVMQSLSLAEDVYFAVAEGHGIFLDLKRDDYVSVPMGIDPGGDRAALSDTAIVEAFEPHRRELLDAGLLVEGGKPEGGLQAHREIVRPASNIFHPDDQRAFGLAGQVGRATRIGVRDWIDFWQSARTASRLLKSQHICETVRRVRERRRAASDRDIDAESIRRHTAIFRKLRPWYPRPYLCLWEALALVEFLARRRLYPLWVFGVQAQPFGAHCWIQVGDVLLNEGTEYAGQFTPIMAV